MRSFWVRQILYSILLSTLVDPAAGQITADKRAVSRSQLCVTEGEVGTAPRNQWSVDAPKMRAYVNGWTSQAIEARFTYAGPSTQQSRLGSGDIRRQFGLKLRAQNACNLVYAMWRFEPESKVVVSIKRNPEQSRSSECGNRGYQNIKPRRSNSTPTVRPGSTHTLSAEFHANDLRVFVDNREVWEGDIGPDGGDLKGPVGIRSDNVRLSFELQAGAPNGPHPHFLQACKSGPEASE